MGLFSDVLGGSSSPDTGAFANVLGGGADPAPSFGTAPATDYGSFFSGAASLLKDIGNTAASVYGSIQSSKTQAAYADPQATAEAAKQVQAADAQKQNSILIFAAIVVTGVVAYLLIEK